MAASPETKLLGVVKMRAKPGCADELIAVFHEWFTRQFEQEAGTEVYVLARSPEDPDVFYSLEVFSNRDAQQAHMRHEAMADVLPRFRPLVESVEPAFLDPVRAKGLDLGDLDRGGRG